MRNMGFSTGALAKGTFREALRMLAPYSLPAIELSALRVTEVMPLLDAIGGLDLEDRYSYISVHAPSSFSAADERWISEALFSRLPEAWHVVLHPDAISDFECWTRFAGRLAIENMDRRKAIGRDVTELKAIFSKLPNASFCFDIGHARQFDSSMTEAFLLLTAFRKRLVQVHASEVNSASQHDSISFGAKLAFQQVADLIDEAIPIIIESRVVEKDIANEVTKTVSAFAVNSDIRSKSDEIRTLFSGLESVIKSLTSPAATEHIL